ncbi:hypothetical protein D3C73_879110 [compost metagenome]
MAARIVLAVRESQYIEPLLHYIHHSDYSGLLRVTAFSRQDTFMEFMKSGETADAVIGDPAFIEAWLVEGKNTVPWAVLSEDGQAAGKNANLAGGAVIAKYQSLPSLLEAVLQLCDVQRSRPAAAAREQTLLLGVVSASGGSGKTTFALNMSKQLTSLGLSVFYLNLESVDSSGLYVRRSSANTPGLERLLYELKSSRGDGSGEVPAKIELGRYVSGHDSLHCEGFRPVENFKEMLQMTQQDTLEVLELLVASGSYDAVIVDTGSIEEERSQAVLQRCSILAWLLRDDEASLYKTTRWLEHGRQAHSGWPPDLLSKSRFLLNFVSDPLKELPAPGGWHIDGLLPYIPAWVVQHHVELCLGSPQFIAAVQQLCKVIVEPELPRVFTGNLHE